jgi:predicted GIY-YIG superfamily endonuclease
MALRSATPRGAKEGEPTKWVYLLESLSLPGRTYKGLTDDPDRRLRDHNEGKVPSTAPWGPWKLRVAVRFGESARAIAFEKYLKSGSGHAFSKKHF